MKGGALALVALGAAPRFLVRTALAQERAGRPRCSSRSSSAARWTASAWWCPTAIPTTTGSAGPSRWPGRARATPDTAVDLDGFFGLHPSLAPLKPLWDDRRLAVVHACGSPDTTRSHFDAQDYMESRHARGEEHARRLAGRAGSPAMPAREPARRSARSRSARASRASSAATSARWR